MHMIPNNVEILFGSENMEVLPEVPYGAKQCEFLEALSKALRSDREAKGYPDIQTFAFWIRKSNILKLKEEFDKTQNAYRLGKGLVFHVAPSNVAINFAFTLVFGVLAGNSNIVKVSSKRFVQTSILCRVLNELAKQEEYAWFQRQNAIVLYERSEQNATDIFSAMCDVRVIWGGDKTIAEVRKASLPPRSIDITFSDRYSFGIVSTDAVMDATESEINRLAEGFYNDTYLMDQNACSSPHMLFWIGDKNKKEVAQSRFWNAVFLCAQKYDLADLKVSDKYTMLCEMLDKIPGASVRRYENLLYVLALDEIDDNIIKYRGKYGLFFETYVENVTDILAYTKHTSVQTCAVYGVDKRELAQNIIQSKGKGIDRIVSFGQTLDIGVMWDGYDIISMLSRKITV